MSRGTRRQARGGEPVERLASILARDNREARSSRRYERQFSDLLLLLAPRIASLIRRYGLGDMREDAEQAAAIGVYRALCGFDPARARFSTHVTWQIRGELQSLRHRMRLDQRRSAVSAGAVTISLDALPHGEGQVFEIVDEAALGHTESGAGDHMARAAFERLLDRLGAPEDERAIVRAYLLGAEERGHYADPRTREQRRQIVRRTIRNCAKLAAD